MGEINRERESKREREGGRVREREKEGERERERESFEGTYFTGELCNCCPLTHTQHSEGFGPWGSMNGHLILHSSPPLLRAEQLPRETA